MNQEKIGKFIANCRKEKNITQEKLAEVLGINVKSVSRWENGKTMPDYSILKALCSELNITVNELLSGEKIKESDYIHKAEENFLNLKKKVDRVVRVINIVEWIITVIIVSLFFIHMYFNWLYIDDWDDSKFSLIVNILLAVSSIGFLITSELKYEIKK